MAHAIYDKKTGRIYLMIFALCTALLVGSAFFSSIATLIPNFISLQFSATRLYTDAFLVGAENATVLNSAMLGLVALATLLLARIKPNAFTVACIFLAIGAGFVGTTVLSVLPMVFGTWLFAKLKNQRYQTFAHETLLAFGLSPIINQVAFGFWGWGGKTLHYTIAIAVGMLIGFVVAPVAHHFGQKNAKFRMPFEFCALGIVNILFCLIYKLVNFSSNVVEDFGVLDTDLGIGSNLWIFFIIVFVIFILVAFLISKHAHMSYLKELVQNRHNDYIESLSFSSIVLNMGIIGLLSLLYFACVGVSFNGITIGLLFMALAMASLGCNPLYMPLVILGLALCSVSSNIDLNEPVMLFAYAFSLGLVSLVRIRWFYAFLASFMFGFINIFSQSLFSGFNVYGTGVAMGLSVVLVLAGHQRLTFKTKP